MEKAMAPHSSTLAWKIPWTEEPGGLQSMGLLRVGHDWATSLSLFTSCIGEGNSNPLQCSCLENPRDSGAWWAAVYGVAQSQRRLKQLSSSSRVLICKMGILHSANLFIQEVECRLCALSSVAHTATSCFLERWVSKAPREAVPLWWWSLELWVS